MALVHPLISLAAAGWRGNIPLLSDILTQIGTVVTAHAVWVEKSTLTLLAGIRFLAVRRESLNKAKVRLNKIRLRLYNLIFKNCGHSVSYASYALSCLL